LIWNLENFPSFSTQFQSQFSSRFDLGKSSVENWTTKSSDGKMDSKTFFPTWHVDWWDGEKIHFCVFPKVIKFTTA
jgi:hypothetical protein